MISVEPFGFSPWKARLQRHNSTQQSTSSWVELRQRSVYSDTTQLNWTQLDVELSCVAINGPLVSAKE